MTVRTFGFRWRIPPRTAAIVEAGVGVDEPAPNGYVNVFLDRARFARARPCSTAASS